MVLPVVNAVNEFGAGDMGTTMDQQSKAQVVEELYPEIKKELEEFIKDFDKDIAVLLNDTPELSTVLGKDTVLKLDLYFDSNLNIRKQTMDLNIALPETGRSPDFGDQGSQRKRSLEHWRPGGHRSGGYLCGRA